MKLFPIFSFYRSEKLHANTATYSAWCRVRLCERRDAKHEALQWIHNGGQMEHWRKQCLYIKDQTGDFTFYAENYSSNEITFTWQANKETPEEFYACRAEFPFNSAMVAFAGKLQRATGTDDYISLSPEKLLAALLKIGAIAGEYHSEIRNYLPDTDFSPDHIWGKPAAQQLA